MKKLTKTKYPDKTSINLVMKEKDHGNPILQIGVFVVFLAFLAVFVRFAVISKLEEAAAAQSAYMGMQSEIQELEERASGYDEVKKEYSHYSNAYLNEEELLETDRLEVLDLIETCVLPMADIQTISITGANVTLTISDTQLPIVSSIVTALQDDERTGYVTVSTAGNDDKEEKSQLVTANIVIELQTGGTAS